MRFDVVIVGGGAAGLSAALVLARARRRVMIVDAGNPRNGVSEHLHGYLTRDGESPTQLLAAGRKEVLEYGSEMTTGTAIRIEHTDDGGFLVQTDATASLEARTVLVATGLCDELPNIAGLQDRWGVDVLHCPYCHGYEVRDSPIGVLGGGNRPFTIHQASLVRQWSEDVVFFPNRIELTGAERERLIARGIRIVEGDVAGVSVGDGRLDGVELASGQVIPRSVVFVGPRFVPRGDLLTDLGCEADENGWVVTDPAGSTSVPGAWAAGNVSDSPAQLITAAAAGSKAAIALNHYLLEQDIVRAVAIAAELQPSETGSNPRGVS
ncbi:NAD(P)/FAD-dependent oxidoreductase [Rhodococcus qingshengii]|uniref:NAD(P)/FAD-dependent oxidoreductase n=1 Tax=Rhodococcus TaxID=1827 RepID=UPI001C4E1B1C|nr:MULTISPECIES: NAD(P)/FAD-dependent oxidoreductase [Rhodococcus]MBQ7805270.1 NAD(P)/FAD-dependent oxidoreductase [Rhodococcus sp. (in: high G+C Gram-positive bacteria)]MDI9955242.1 NAD(P)/FAD-dependent oxidoreductase [Rhodococcus sp. IEGM 1237]MDI9961263.1 NAD(P)/FAD-dependent oxidoreductase [Rhodococcus sp. IEGM 1251]MDJ0485140.1 NAD(P)/FAD-dependent oxidoreductase [Rhodococcus qingshengii]MDV8123307.1 NAD(P)/FAD-dependent oxidoreductase [Rhodococcus sp. IEGM 1304]